VSEVEPVSGKSVSELMKKTVSSWSEINAPRLGAALAFYTLLSIAPLLVVCISIAGMIFGAKAAEDQIAAQIGGVVGWQNAETLQTLLQHANKPAAGIVATAVGFLTLLFGASGVFGELRDSMNTVWGVKGTSGSGIVGMVRYRFVSFAMVLGIGFLLLVSLVLSAAIAAAGKFLEGRLPIPESVMQLTSTAVTFLTVTILFALLYKFVPDVHIEWGDVAIGAAVTSALFSVGKFLIALYLGKASVGSTYGAAGSLVVFIVWVYYSAQIFFLGAQFTRVFAERHGSRAKERAGASEDSERKRDVNRFRNPKLA
jgi:membrane protein